MTFGTFRCFGFYFNSRKTSYAADFTTIPLRPWYHDRDSVSCRAFRTSEVNGTRSLKEIKGGAATILIFRLTTPRMTWRKKNTLRIVFFYLMLVFRNLIFSVLSWNSWASQKQCSPVHPHAEFPSCSPTRYPIASSTSCASTSDAKIPKNPPLQKENHQLKIAFLMGYISTPRKVGQTWINMFIIFFIKPSHWSTTSPTSTPR